uniref:Metalloendopeptidase n=1 Tax=Parastrongyloides trichosuri TaxID=131310 RepID=A0A0N4ZTU0_PARTI
MSFFLCVYGGIYNDTEHEWKFPIQYRVWNAVDTTYIDKAFYLISNNTCLNFTKNDELKYEEPGIIFGNIGQGYYSNSIGPKNNKAVTIFLDHQCRRKEACIISLILQAIGVFPEQTRQDRDEYVSINYDNINNTDDTIYFNKSDPTITSDYDTKYDYGSLVQYYRKSYSKNDQDTISSKGEYGQYYQLMLGQKNVATLNDYKILSRRYCANYCDEKKSKRCAHGGYKNPRNCSQCVCPFPYKGEICTEKIESTLTKKQGCDPIQKTVSKRGQTYQYNGKGICVETFIASEGKKVQLKILEQSTTPQTPCARNSSMVEVQYREKDKREVMGLCFCGSITNSDIITSEGTNLILIYNGERNEDYLKVELKAID